MLILIVDRRADHRINIVIHEQHELIKAIHDMLQEQSHLAKEILHSELRGFEELMFYANPNSKLLLLNPFNGRSNNATFDHLM